MLNLGWLLSATSHPQGNRGVAAAVACLGCVAVLAYCCFASHSLVIMAALWISVFALCSLLAALYSMTITHKPMQKFSYGLARVPVLAVFSTTVLAQLFSIFLSKESFEHLLAPGHHGGHDEGKTAEEHGEHHLGGWPFYLGAIAVSWSLLLSAYALKNQPFQHVLTAAGSSSLQEHAADISQAVCWVIPGLSRLLLPRINAMVLLAGTAGGLLLLCEHFQHDFAWSDPVCCLVLCIAVFSTMWPLSTYTGMILLQTAPPHLLNQIDRCISEASTTDGVLEIRAGHFWQLDFAQLVGSVDVRVRRDADEQNVLTLVTDKLSSVVSILTVQIVKDAAGWQSRDYLGDAITHHEPSYSSHDSHGHSHNSGGHGHSHDDDGHGHSHAGGGHGHSHDVPDSHGHSHSAVPSQPTPYQGYSMPELVPATTPQPHHGHSYDGVTYH